MKNKNKFISCTNCPKFCSSESLNKFAGLLEDFDSFEQMHANCDVAKKFLINLKNKL